MLLSEELSRQTNPMILLWDTDVKELERILDFMYFGEVKVSVRYNVHTHFNWLIDCMFDFLLFLWGEKNVEKGEFFFIFC